MRTLLAIIYCFLNLAGCTDAQNRSIVATAQENGKVVLDSLTDVRMGRAWFECKASQSGRCYYTVFHRDAQVRAFSLKATETLRLDNLPAGFSQCVATSESRVLPGDCRAG
jgi:hypothetical protein